MPRARARDYDDKRQAILAAAARLFARNGFEATSIADIARACRTSKAGLYHYFDAKEAILFALLDGHVRGLIAVARGAVEPEAPPERQLQALVGALMAIYATAGDTHVVLMNALGALPASQQRRLVAAQKEVVAVARAILLRLRPDLARDARQAPVAMALFGMINWTYTWFRADGPVSPAAFAELAAAIFLHGIGAVPIHDRPRG